MKKGSWKYKKLSGTLFSLSIFFLFLFSLNIINAQPPFIGGGSNTFSSGYFVEFTPIFTYEHGKDIQINAHVFNISNGIEIRNETTICKFSFFDKTGNHVINNQNMTFDTIGEDWEYIIPTSNLTENNIYAYLINCQDKTTGLGGFVIIDLEITRTGKRLSVEESYIYLILSIGVLILFLLSFYFMLVIPYGNKVNEKGAVIQISKLKYVKLGLILLTWVLFTWVLNILIGLSDNFVSLTMYYGFFGFMFDVMNNLAFPLGIFIIVLSGFEIIRDTNIYENIKKFGSSR